MQRTAILITKEKERPRGTVGSTEKERMWLWSVPGPAEVDKMVLPV